MTKKNSTVTLLPHVRVSGTLYMRSTYTVHTKQKSTFCTHPAPCTKENRLLGPETRKTVLHRQTVVYSTNWYSAVWYKSTLKKNLQSWSEKKSLKSTMLSVQGGPHCCCTSGLPPAQYMNDFYVYMMHPSRRSKQAC